MNRITSPLNVASLIFIVLTIVCVSEVRSSQRRAAYDAATVDYVAGLRENRDTQIYRVQAQLPVRSMEWLSPMFTAIEQTDSCVVLHCNYDHFSDRYDSVDDCYLFCTSASDPEYSMVDMLAKAFSPEFVDCLLANEVSLRLVATLNGAPVEDYTLTPAMLRKGYTNGLFDGRLKRWVRQLQEE
ncbi:hypothetical protein [uncultured Muribaculum sp.]|uniref:hypothetical protein n=1 Tax=uncultured Muribaculum sp. TaxID=1918613 RepID=UPI00261C7E10|nr:hypothetical protein [uncultured Muribaculum sp.]